MAETVTIYIADSGARKYDQDNNIVESKAGHIWLKADDGNGNVEYRGFSQAPGYEGQTEVPGQVHTDDNEIYIDVDYQRTIVLTDEQYANLIDYLDTPAAYGFISGTYSLFKSRTRKGFNDIHILRGVL